MSTEPSDSLAGLRHAVYQLRQDLQERIERFQREFPVRLSIDIEDDDYTYDTGARGQSFTVKVEARISR